MKHWPAYLPDRDKETQLVPAILYQGKIITNTDELTFNNWREFRQTIILEELCLFVRTLTDSKEFPYMNYIRQSKGCTVHETTEWIKVSLLYLGRRYWIVPASQWGWEDSTPEFLQHISSVFTHCGGFVKPTPPSLGTRLLLESWSHHNAQSRRLDILDTDWPAEYIPEKYRIPKRRHPLPPKATRMTLKDELHGGRIQCVSETLPGYFKLDQDNALLEAFGSLPTGVTHRTIQTIRLTPSTSLEQFNSSTAHLGVTFFCRVLVQIPNNTRLALGPFPVRKPSLHWPTTSGVYDCWLWKEQIADTILSGCEVTITEGWYWRYFTQDTQTWIQYMIDLRKTAPTLEVKKAIKRIASSAISCLGIGDVRYSTKQKSDLKDGDRATPLYDERGRLNIYATSSRDSLRPTPVHWYAYTWMQVGRTLYRMALPHAQANELVALHTDALWIKTKPEPVEGWKLEEILSHA